MRQCRKWSLIALFFAGFFFLVQTTFAQEKEVQELRYFKSDNAFYLGNTRLLDSEIKLTLSDNLSAFEAWKKGNAFKKSLYCHESSNRQPTQAKAWT